MGIEMSGGLGSAEPVVGAVENEFVLYAYAAPVLRIQFGKLAASFALRAPLGDAWGWTRLITSLDLSVGF